MKKTFTASATAITAILTLSSSAWGLKESTLETQYENVILPHLESSPLETLHTEDHIKIAYKRFLIPKEAEKAAIVVVLGRTESLLKYAELYLDLNQMGYSIYVYDHRGQGLSDRLTDYRQKGHVERFSDYRRDLQELIEAIVVPKGHERIHLLGHSMGGAIVLDYLRTEPQAIHSAILSSPMLKIQTGSFPEVAAWLVTQMASFIGKDLDYALGQGDWKPDRENRSTHSAIRYALAQDLYNRYPELKLGGVTNQWLSQSIKSTMQIRRRPRQVKVPLLLLSAATDAFVHVSPQESYCHQTTACQWHPFSEAFHEIFQETDSIRATALDLLDGFLTPEMRKVVISK